jgi:hypothetical protein
LLGSGENVGALAQIGIERALDVPCSANVNRPNSPLSSSPRKSVSSEIETRA